MKRLIFLSMFIILYSANFNIVECNFISIDKQNCYHSWNGKKVTDIMEYFIDPDTIVKNPPIYEVDYHYIIHCSHRNRHTKIGGSFKMQFAPRHYYQKNIRDGDRNELYWAKVKKNNGYIFQIGKVREGRAEMAIYRRIVR